MEWIINSDLWFASIFVWDNTYTPHQCVMFRRNIGNSCYIKAYFSVEDKIYMELFDISYDIDTLEDELLFHITRTLRDILNHNIDKWLNNSDHKKIEDLESTANDDNILSKIFFDANTMLFYKGVAPDFGFYSLSPNFHGLRTLFQEGRTPDINEEFDRLNHKYKTNTNK